MFYSIMTPSKTEPKASPIPAITLPAAPSVLCHLLSYLYQQFYGISG